VEFGVSYSGIAEDSVWSYSTAIAKQSFAEQITWRPHDWLEYTDAGFYI